MEQGTYKILMGNEAIARGLIENGCSVAASYPGTPASEILSSLAQMAKEEEVKMHLEWSINEKAAFEISLSNSYLGSRSAVSMKQVGLNVALDSLMSAAYSGVRGGFIVVSADDPGPYSSQTEQDSRFLAMFAKIPVFDPSSPQEAKEMVGEAFALSEEFEIPVMLRPTTRVCHARQNLFCYGIQKRDVPVSFRRDPNRWAATPRFRYFLHRELNKKLERIAVKNFYLPIRKPTHPFAKNGCILASGVAFAHVYDLLEELDLLDQISLYQIKIPYPLSKEFLEDLSSTYDEILILEETYPVIELQMVDRRKVMGKLNKFVPEEGELSPEIIRDLLVKFLNLPQESQKPITKGMEKGPTLCPGCPHRASFFAIREALPHAIYPSDIGCYTLGLNLKAVDTVLCMGASINQASGFYHSFALQNEGIPTIVVTIGDSTFYHAGITGLINSVLHKARFILVIMDNFTTAMTGNQATPEIGLLADGSQGFPIRLRDLITACGIRFLKEVDPYSIHELISHLKEAEKYCSSPEGGVAVIIANHPCVLEKKVLREQKRYQMEVSDTCTGCGYCLENFECPAIIMNTSLERVEIDKNLCIGCGVCREVCPLGAITIMGGQ